MRLEKSRSWSDSLDALIARELPFGGQRGHGVCHDPMGNPWVIFMASLFWGEKGTDQLHIPPRFWDFLVLLILQREFLELESRCVGLKSVG